MTTFNNWASYFYPDSYDPVTRTGTMRNRFDERDADALRDAEYFNTLRRRHELQQDPALIPRTYDAAHVAAIHGYLFQDVYEWAGQFRTVGISKAWPPELGQGYTDFLDRQKIKAYLDAVQQRIVGYSWGQMSRDEFARATADIFSRINFAHPAREGNGRTTRVFMEHVAELSPFELDFNPQSSGITPNIWNRASTLTSPDPGSTEPVPDEMVAVFARFTQPRQGAIRQLDIQGERARSDPPASVTRQREAMLRELRRNASSESKPPNERGYGYGE